MSFIEPLMTLVPETTHLLINVPSDPVIVLFYISTDSPTFFMVV